MRTRLIPLMTLIAMVLIACSAAPSGGNSAPQPKTTIAPTNNPAPTELASTNTAQPAIEVVGAGASLPATLYAEWFELFSFVTSRPNFTYNDVGSERGIEMLLNGEVDFAGSEIPLTAEQQAQAPDLVMFPTAASAVVIAYNLTDPNNVSIRSGLRFDASTLGGIYMGEITRWNDPAIAALNPDVQLPDQEIVVMQRAPGSGTTFLFTTYLKDLNPAWRRTLGSGETIAWPVGTTVESNAEMAAAIQDTPYSIGYVSQGDSLTNYLTYASIKNREGRFVEPTTESVQAAQTATIKHMPNTMEQVIVNPQGNTSYPIVGYTYLIFSSDMADCNKAWAILSWYRWAVLLGDVAASQAGFAPLIPEIEEAAFARFPQLFCGGHQPIPRLAVPLG